MISKGELAAPTNNINTTVALSLLTSLAYFGGGLVKKAGSVCVYLYVCIYIYIYLCIHM